MSVNSVRRAGAWEERRESQNRDWPSESVSYEPSPKAERHTVDVTKSGTGRPGKYATKGVSRLVLEFGVREALEN